MKKTWKKKLISLVLAFDLMASFGGTVILAETNQPPEVIITENEDLTNNENTNDINNEIITKDNETDVSGEENKSNDVTDETVAETPTEQQSSMVQNNEQQVAPQDIIQGDGFNFDDTTGVLTITESTSDYTPSTINQAPYYSYRDQITEVVIDGDENTEIGTYSFYGFTNMGKITIIKCGDIHDKAFYNWSSAKLKSIEIGTCGNIGSDAFGNLSLTDFIVTESCGDLADSLFSGKTKLTNVQITQCGNIGIKAFYGCTGLSKLSLNCGDIGDEAFQNCSNLKDVTITKAGNIGKLAFAKAGLINVRVIACGDIAYSAFSDNTSFLDGGSLESLTIESCGNIGSSAFANLNDLKTVEIEQCGTIGTQAFLFTSNLTNVTIRNCSSIEDSAFMSAGAPIKELTLENCEIKETAFYMAEINNLTLRNITSIEDAAFQSSTIDTIHLDGIDQLGDGVFAGVEGLTNLIIDNVDRIEEGTFEIYDTTLGNNVEKLTLRDVGYIGDYAFYHFNNLKEVVIEETCEYVGAHAFTGCDSLETISISDQTRLGYSDSFVNQDAIHERVQGVLAGGFSLMDTSVPIQEISPEGWTSYKNGESNSTENVGDTQITKEAKWNNEELTTADVLLKTYYSANQQMDFIFVADCSNSMSGFGADNAMNSNFYNMQSKMMDVSEELLNSENLDTRIAFSTFGESEGEVSRFFEKGEAAEAQSYIWNDIVNYESNTNYATGLSGALELVQANAGRNTTVIFISDGQPYYPGEVPESYYGVSESQAIRNEGVQIISVLQQVPADKVASSEANIAQISDQIYTSTDLSGFSNAINSAIDYAYTTYKVTDTIDPAFTLDENSIVISEGTTYEISTDQNGNTVITWTISGHPYEELTMQYQLNLKPNADGTYSTGDFDTNEGYATIDDGNSVINQVETPALSRPGEETTPPTEEKPNDENITKPTSSTKKNEGTKTSTITNQNFFLLLMSISSCLFLTVVLVKVWKKKKNF